MKEVRVEVDEAYRDIVKRINALIIVDGAGPYEAFTNEQNTRIEKYTNIIKQREGKNKKE